MSTDVSATWSDVVVLHVSDAPADVTRATASAKTLVESIPSARVRIIVNGAAIEGLTRDAPPLHRVPATSIEACRIGMAKHDIEESALQESVEVTPSAVVALAEAQRAGAAYIRI